MRDNKKTRLFAQQLVTYEIVPARPGFARFSLCVNCTQLTLAAFKSCQYLKLNFQCFMADEIVQARW